MRAEMRPPASDVATVIAVGSVSPPARASSSSAVNVASASWYSAAGASRGEFVSMHRDASTHTGYDFETVETLLEALTSRLPRRRAALVGLSGLQGSGKSTLARQIAAAASAHGIATEVLALDDFYRGRGERAVLARTIHPLLATRGVPGTHDLALLDRTLRALGK